MRTDTDTAAAGFTGERRPGRALLSYYIIQSVLTGPGIIIVLPLRFFRWRTLHYTFDDEGVSMRWGILFRREISLTYARIQDIHLVSNVIERWLGLGRVQVQTASGQAGAEMTIEGLPDYEAVRDRLYRRMRGSRTAPHGAGAGAAAEREKSASESVAGDVRALAEVESALRETTAELRALRELLAARTPQ